MVQQVWLSRLGVPAAALAAALGAPVRAHPPGEWSADGPGTMRENFPPHRVADLHHMRLNVTIADMNTPVLRATQTLSLSPLGGPLAELPLDAVLLEILSVEAAPGSGTTATFTHDGERLVVRFDPPVPEGQTITLITTYQANDPPRGLLWTPESPAWPGRAAQIHTQGQPETNRYWFPIHDFPNERLTTELVVTAPAGYLVSSNGRLVSRQRGVLPARDAGSDAGVAGLRGYETFHWLQDKPHVPYLVSLVVGEFEVVDLGVRRHNPKRLARPQRLSMPVYVPPGLGAWASGTYGRTPDMVSVFEEVFDEPYPWDRYAQLVVHNFESGGMENTAATTMYDTAIIEPGALLDHDLEGLISHELAHQWFGNLITSGSWEHIWLNEGWATYAESLWFERSRGPDGYAEDVLGNFDAVIARDRGTAPGTPAMVSRLFSEPWDTFRRDANPYSKGASVLHMLRRKLGDGVFFRGVREYVERFKFQTVETGDFRRVMEEVSGQSLEQFFAQWCFRPGVPRLAVTSAWDPGRGVVSVSAEQTQTIDGDNPAFEFDMPVLVGAPGSGEGRPAGVLSFRGREASVEIPSASEPAWVALDPDLHVLAEVTIAEPRRWSINALTQGPTLASRVRAARTLGRDASQTGSGALASVAARGDEHVRVRVEAARALAARGDGHDLEVLVGNARDRWELREAVARGLGEAAASEAGRRDATLAGLAINALSRRAQTDESARVRAAALEGLGKIGGAADVPVFEAGLVRESQDDRVRQAALNGLAATGLPQAVPLVVRFTREDTNSRTRAVAAAALARLHPASPDVVHARLVELLGDRLGRVRRAAGEGLASIGEPRGLEAIRAWGDAARDPADKRQAARWLDRAGNAGGDRR
jgi:aminopeptidase N